MTQTSREVQRRLRARNACSQVQLARVGVCVLVVDVVCVMLVVLIVRVDIHAVSTQFSKSVFCSWRCTLYTPRR